MNSVKVNIRAITIERSHFEKLNDIEKNHIFDSENIKNSYKIFSGQAAGICYAPDNYMSDLIQNEDAALRRAKFNSKSGHYSVFDHAHITIDIECSKALALVLNSTRLYSTSEKSARYTKMQLSDSEKEIYDWWKNKFEEIIKLYYDNLSDKDVEKLAMENARYLTSVFTPTIMEFTVPYSRAILLIEWLDQLSSFINNTIEYNEDTEKNDQFDAAFSYYIPLAKECTDMANEIRKALNEDIENPTLRDHKDIGIKFFTDITKARYSEPTTKVSKVSEYYGDIYKSKYKASLASIAQIERHRTIHVEISFPDQLSKNSCYVPSIIKGTPLEDKWKNTYVDLVRSGIIPQCTLVEVIEMGLLSDFILKCKERLCARTQLETTEIVTNQVEHFLANIDNITDPYNIYNLEAMKNKSDNSDEKVVTRCKMHNYICNEPCNRIKSNYKRLI